MRLTLLTLLIVPAIASLLPLAAPAAGDDLPSREDFPGSFHPFNVTGPHKNQFHSLVCEHGLNPVALVFIRGDDLKPAWPLLQKLDAAVVKNDRSFLGSFAVLLHDDVLDDQQRAAVDTKAEDLIKDDDERAALAKSVNEGPAGNDQLPHVVVGLYSSAGPQGYQVGKGKVTVILYRKYRLLGRFEFNGDMTDSDVDAVMAAVQQRLLTPKK